VSKASSVRAFLGTVAGARWMRPLQLAATLALTIWIVVSLGEPAVAALKRFDFTVLLGALALFASAQIFGGLRLAVLLSGTAVPWRDAIMTTWAGYFFSNFLPSTIGGDIFRLGRLASRGVETARAAGILVLDRIFNLVATFVLLALGMTGRFPQYLMKGLSLNHEKAVLVLIGGAIILGGMIFFALASARIRNMLQLALRPLRELRRNPVIALSAFVLSILNLGVAILAQWLIIRQLHGGVSLIELTVIVCTVTLIVLVPVSFNGLGLQEGAFAYFLVQAGVSLSVALVYGLLVRVLIVMTSAIGGLLFAAERARAVPGARA